MLLIVVLVGVLLFLLVRHVLHHDFKTSLVVRGSPKLLVQQISKVWFMLGVVLVDVVIVLLLL